MLLLRLSILCALGLVLGCGGASSHVPVETPATLPPPLTPPARDPTFAEMLGSLEPDEGVVVVDQRERERIASLLGPLASNVTTMMASVGRGIGGRVVCSRSLCFGARESDATSALRNVAGFDVVGETRAHVGPSTTLDVREATRMDAALSSLAASIEGRGGLPAPASLVRAMDLENAHVAQIMRGSALRPYTRAIGQSFDIFAQLQWFGARIHLDDPIRVSLFGLAPSESVALLVESSARQAIGAFRDNFVVRFLGLGMLLERATVTRDGNLITATTYASHDETRSLVSRFSQAGIQVPVPTP